MKKKNGITILTLHFIIWLFCVSTIPVHGAETGAQCAAMAEAGTRGDHPGHRLMSSVKPVVCDCGGMAACCQSPPEIPSGVPDLAFNTVPGGKKPVCQNVTIAATTSISPHDSIFSGITNHIYLSERPPSNPLFLLYLTFLC